MKTSIFLLKCTVLFTIVSSGAQAAEPGRPRLNIRHDRENNRVVVTWYGGEGRLARTDRLGSMGFRSMSMRETPAPLEIEGDQGTYALVNTAGNVVSENIVGYVNLQLPWGMSFIANPL